MTTAAFARTPSLFVVVQRFEEWRASRKRARLKPA